MSMILDHDHAMPRPLMTKTERDIKLDEIDRLLNDPDTCLHAGRVWSLLAEVAQQERVVTACPAS